MYLSPIKLKIGVLHINNTFGNTLFTISVAASLILIVVVLAINSWSSPTQNLNHTNAHTFRGSLYEKKHLDYNPVKRVFRLAGMILILIWHEKFRPVSRDENVTWCCFEFSLVWFSVWVTVQPSLLSIQHSFLAFQFQDLIP